MRGLICSSEIYAIIKTDVSSISLKNLFFFFSFFLLFFLKGPTDVLNFLSLFFHTPLPTFFYPFPNARWVKIYKYIYTRIHIFTHKYNVLYRCFVRLFQNAPFFLKGQKYKTTDGWRPKVVSMETVFFLFWLYFQWLQKTTIYYTTVYVLKFSMVLFIIMFFRVIIEDGAHINVCFVWSSLFSYHSLKKYYLYI